MSDYTDSVDRPPDDENYKSSNASESSQNQESQESDYLFNSFGIQKQSTTNTVMSNSPTQINLLDRNSEAV